MEVWTERDRNLAAELFHQGLWDAEVHYVETFMLATMMRTLRTRQQFIAAADEMDRRHPPSYRSEHGQFHRMRRGRAVMAEAWAQWEESEKASKNGGGQRPQGGAVAQVAAT